MQGKRPEGGSCPMDKRKIKWWLIILNVLMILAALAGTHLMTLINDVLDISRVESGKSVLNPEPFQVNALLSNLESIVRPQAENKKQAFTVECTHLEYPTVVGDQLRLNQILLNLLTNSVKYTPEGGKIELKCWENPSFDGHVLLSWRINDNGMGMTEQFQKEMYDSFAREVDSRINRIQGSGLGLAIVKQMVDLMHGSINCQSAPGSGSHARRRRPGVRRQLRRTAG